MTDTITKERRSWNMSQIRSTGTKPEKIVRKLVHGMGYRYRLHRKGLPGKPDLVFGPRRKIIFVHGCFWHQHMANDCLDGRKPKSNTLYWNKKLSRNVERDAENRMQLSKLGWDVLVVWECETKNIDELLQKLDRFLIKPLPADVGTID
jgi:DNA mismatch endonuclease, patch repair protein